MKTKITLLNIFLSILVFNCSADILVYNFSGKQITTQSGQKTVFPLEGSLFYDLATTNVTIVHWNKTNNEKSIWIEPAAKYAAVVIEGPGTASVTALARVPLSPQTNSVQYLGSPMLGQNRVLKIGMETKVSFPRTFTYNDVFVSYSQDGTNSLMKTAESYVFSSSRTVSANDNVQTVDEAVNVLVQSLEAKGYQMQ